ncbi:MAG TPA: hypothetical protein VFG69_14415 [Nannocystaceae bacterium]|nr:hypothetical protein [Nannocystaceae bacterium]
MTTRDPDSVRIGAGDEPTPDAPEPRPAEPPPGLPSPDTTPEVQPVPEPTPAPSPTPAPMPDRELPHVVDPVARGGVADPRRIPS